MRSMTAADALRDFYAMLDAAEQGEEFILTRDGVPIARLVPERLTTAERIEEAMTRHPVDPAWADDLEEVVRELRAETDQERVWPAE